MLSISVADEGKARVFRLEGTLDSLEAGQLKKMVRAAIASGQADVIIDFAETTFADSAGLGALVALHKTALAAGGRLRLRSLRENVHALMELTRLHRFFEIIDAPSSRER